VAVGLITLIVPQFRRLFIANAHGVAGTLMIFSFIATAFLHGVRRRATARVATLAPLSLVLPGDCLGDAGDAKLELSTAHLVNSNWLGDLFIIVLETLLILQFAAYWVVQTIELWDTPDPRPPLPNAPTAALGSADEEWPA